MEKQYISEYRELVTEWSEKNNIRPEDVTKGSHKKLWWKGKCGHEWEAVVKNRVNGSGCPICSGNKVVTGENDLETCCPDVAAEWSDKNEQFSPQNVAIQSNKKVWWKCRFGHEWKAKIADRTRGHGCPYCAGKILAGFNDLMTTRPDVMEEWSVNNVIDPLTITEHSTELALWKCGNEWKAVVATKARGKECPFCRHEISKQNYRRMLENRKKKRYLKCHFAEECFRYYIEKYDLPFEYNDDSRIGIPFQFYSEKYNIAVELVAKEYSNSQRKYEQIKNELSIRSGIKLIRIMAKGIESFDDCLCIFFDIDSGEELLVAIQTVTDFMNIEIEVDAKVCKRIMNNNL